MLAKLLFRDDQKHEAEDIIKTFLGPMLSPECTSCKLTNPYKTEEDIADAFYILGWISIHSDAHTEAYGRWSHGCNLVPSDIRLIRQRNKTRCWSGISKCTDPFPSSSCVSLIGNGDHANGNFTSDDFEVFPIPVGRTEPSLGLFDEATQGRNLIFKTKKSVLTVEECDEVISIVEEHIKIKGLAQKFTRNKLFHPKTVTT